MAQTAAELGRVDLLLGLPIHNTAALFHILQSTARGAGKAHGCAGCGCSQHAHPPGITRRRAWQQLRATLETLAPVRLEGQRSRAELLWAADMLAHAVRRGLWMLNGQPAGDADALAADADRLIATFDEQWHARHRPGGFADAHARLMTMRAAYENV